MTEIAENINIIQTCNCGNNTCTIDDVANFSIDRECHQYCNATNNPIDNTTVNNNQTCKTDNGLSSNNENSKI